MISLILNDETYKVIDYNIHYDRKRELYQLWIIRHSGKSFKVAEDKQYDKIKEMKSAMDFAVEKGENALVLK